MPTEIDVEQIREWKRKADLYDAVVDAVGTLGGRAPAKRGRPKGKRAVSRKGRKSIAGSMKKRWAEARRLHKAKKIDRPDLKALKAYEAKQA